MSYALSAYLVPRDQILRFPGIADDELLRKCLAGARERLDDLDHQLFDEDDEEDITHEQAFRELFSGEITANFHGARYGWAFETLCDCLGESLSNRGFSPCDIEWYEQLDDHLETSDVAVRFDDLINNCPIDIPLSDDWPMIGHWSHQQIFDSKDSITTLAAAATDPDMAEALTAVNEWINDAVKDSGTLIIGFHG